MQKERQALPEPGDDREKPLPISWREVHRGAHQGGQRPTAPGRHQARPVRRPGSSRLWRTARATLEWARIARESGKTSESHAGRIENPMTSTARVKAYRQRRRKGIVRMARVEISEDNVRALAKSGRLDFTMKEGNTHIHKEAITPAAERLLADLLARWTSEQNREHA